MSDHSHSHSHSHSHDPETDSLQVFSSLVQSFAQLFSKVGAILNLFHLLVLTRKFMMTSSVNAIMIGIALCDLLSMCNVIRIQYMVVNPMGTDCIPPPTLLRMNMDWFLTSFQNGLRRCSSWLAVLIALMRYLVITRILNRKIASPQFGFSLVFCSFLLSTLFSVLFFSEFHFGQIDTWRPEEYCEGYEKNLSAPIFGQLCNELYEVQQGLFHRVQLVLEGVIGKLIPCIFLPILTGLLLRKLRKSNLSVGITEVSVSTRHTRSQHKDRMTTIVIFIAITFLITEFPLGIVYLANAIWHHDDDVQKTIKTVEFLCNAIFTANASLHCSICFSMSTSYRKTVFDLLSIIPFVEKQRQTTVSVVSKMT